MEIGEKTQANGVWVEAVKEKNIGTCDGCIFDDNECPGHLACAGRNGTSGIIFKAASSPEEARSVYEAPDRTARILGRVGAINNRTLEALLAVVGTTSIIPAVKVTRILLGCSLLEAKTLCEELKANGLTNFKSKNS